MLKKITICAHFTILHFLSYAFLLFVHTQDLIDSINVIRFSRFESALKEVFTAAKDGETNKQSKAELQKHVVEMLGGFYMHYHRSVS